MSRAIAGSLSEISGYICIDITLLICRQEKNHCVIYVGGMNFVDEGTSTREGSTGGLYGEFFPLDGEKSPRDTAYR